MRFSKTSSSMRDSSPSTRSSTGAIPAASRQPVVENMLALSSTPTDTPANAGTRAVAVAAGGLTRSFGGGVLALAGIDLEIPASELVALIGANGSGMSTVLIILFGILEPDAGELRVMDLRPRRDRAALREMAGYAGQDIALDLE